MVKSFPLTSILQTGKWWGLAEMKSKQLIILHIFAFKNFDQQNIVIFNDSP